MLDKPYVGLYPLRKRETQHRAYAVFGASGSLHGFHLLSDAVARDWGALKDFDLSRGERDLFSEVERHDEQLDEFEQLYELVLPVLRRHPRLTGQKLAIYVYRSLKALDAIFGRYKERDYSQAARVYRGSNPDG